MIRPDAGFGVINTKEHPMANPSLVPDETRALIGQALSEPLTGTITAKDAQRFALAADDLNPLYFDEEAAHAAGYRTTLVPPIFLAWALAPARPVGETREDGLYRGGGRRVTLNVKRVMFGGEDWEYVEPVFAGDTITSETRLKSLEEKQGGSGAFVLQMTETTYTNQHDRIVATATGRSIAR
jgi:acyl dehydratase